MPKVIMNSKEFIERAKKLASRKTFYKNKWPYNLCYINTDGRTSADCLNLYKAILNGYDVNRTEVGYYQKSLSNTGDCSEYGLIKQCTDISSDFSKLKEGEPRLLYMSGHIGAYVGENKINGGVYNVIEATANFGGGIVYSWVDSDGTRRDMKGGVCIVKKSGEVIKWEKHGLMTPWVNYIVEKTEDKKEENKKSVDDLAKEVIDGKWGNGDERKKKLTDAGYNYSEVQKRVNELLKPKAPTTPDYYIVQPNDSLSQIAAKYGTTWQKLMYLNNIKNPNLIYAGERIRLK